MTEVVLVDVPALLVFNTLDQNSLRVGTVMKMISKLHVISESQKEEAYDIQMWNVPLTRYVGQLYEKVVFARKVLFSSAQLHHLHRKPVIHPRISFIVR